MMADEERATPEAAVTVEVAGIARGNPGLAGAGIVIVDEKGATLTHVARYLGNAQPLEAQLQALLLALRYARPYTPAPLTLILNNDTAVRQIGGEAPARHPAVLRVLADLDTLLAPFAGATYHLARGEELAEAMRLANLGIDTRLRPLPSYDPPLPAGA